MFLLSCSDDMSKEVSPIISEVFSHIMLVVRSVSFFNAVMSSLKRFFQCYSNVLSEKVSPIIP